MSNRRRTAPIYLQLARRIQDRIDSGDLPSGSRLPSEPELCEEFDVNRLTIRQAIAELERAASVEIRRGGHVRPLPIARVSIAVDPRSQRFDLGSLTAAIPHGAAGAGDVEDGTERITAVVPSPRTPADSGAAGHLRCDPAELSRLESIIFIGPEPWGVNSYWLKSSLLPEELSAPGAWTTSSVSCPGAPTSSWSTTGGPSAPSGPTSATPTSSVSRRAPRSSSAKA